MGGTQSTPENDEKIFESQVPLNFSQDLVNHLAENLPSTATSPARQEHLDSQVRKRIDEEAARLRDQDASVKEAIRQALDASIQHDAPSSDDGPSSPELQKSLDQVIERVQRLDTQRQSFSSDETTVKGQAVVECYKKHSKTPLDCWREVAEFHASVAELEKKYVKSLV
ncbi:hypothetical protein SISNIDRAFT_448160 [Sistotremastrum niveocremeum HHB9708]|uniref:DUF1690-domain-containing protein n=2 Tax=Sistotremastraceae TaxID=3402574 RepID=A0A165AMH0_9AGAM|nr:hypothetical protein SISNIDRAFT_448160 [Sistotremastrum niveocremeum HHB9708]KZT42107.1 hypothetical protein SISSUDRAFT_1042053 [Sistotremastrum suecicum HHB10207 ss-3]